MSNLSDFFGGGGPSNILRGSTSFQTEAAAASGNSNNLDVVTVNTGVFVDANNTYLTQGCRGDVQYWNISPPPNVPPPSPSPTPAPNIRTNPAFSGSGSARINGSGEIVITSAVGSANSRPSPNPFLGGNIRNSAVQKGIVDWEAVEYG